MSSGVELLPSHVDEFMWREVYDQAEAKDMFLSFLAHMKEKFRAWYASVHFSHHPNHGLL